MYCDPHCGSLEKKAEVSQTTVIRQAKRDLNLDLLFNFFTRKRHRQSMEGEGSGDTSTDIVYRNNLQCQTSESASHPNPRRRLISE